LKYRFAHGAEKNYLKKLFFRMRRKTMLPRMKIDILALPRTNFVWSRSTRLDRLQIVAQLPPPPPSSIKVSAASDTRAAAP